MWALSFAPQRRVLELVLLPPLAAAVRRATNTTAAAAAAHHCYFQPHAVFVPLSHPATPQKATVHTTPMARKRAAIVAAEDAEPKRRASARLRGSQAEEPRPAEKALKTVQKKAKVADKEAKTADTVATTRATKDQAKVKHKKETQKATSAGGDADNQDPDPDSLPDVNPEVERHEGEWYWLMKAEPESRFENGIDVKFSIDDLRARTKPEPWDGIRNYAARNNFKAMNHGDKAFFYHSNTKEPGIVGIMEIVKEYSEDVSARRPGTAYYDPQSTKDKPRWGLVHVRFVKKFAVQIGLPELRELGSQGKLPDMQMLKQTRLSVSKVGQNEFKMLCELADKKAAAAGLEHVV